MENLHILVIDDDKSVTDMIEEILKKDYLLKAFNDSKKALECILKGSFDLILTDLKCLA